MALIMIVHSYRYEHIQHMYIMYTHVYVQTRHMNCSFTCTSFTKDQLDTNLSVRRFLTGEQPRGPSLSVRPEPQHD